MNLTNTHRAIRRARRRIIAQRFLSTLSWALCAALCVSLIALLAGRLIALEPPLWLPVALLGAAAIVSLLVTVVRRPGIEHTAARIDARLNLKDRLGTALHAQHLLTTQPFA